MASSSHTVWMSCSSPSASLLSKEEGEADDSTSYTAEGHDDDRASQTVAGHGIECADEKPLHQETHQIHPQ
jgi:hypothetical protein